MRPETGDSGALLASRITRHSPALSGVEGSLVTRRLLPLITACQRECERKDAASALFALQPDLATVRLDRQLAEGQAQAGAAHLTTAHLAKFLEYSLVIRW